MSITFYCPALSVHQILVEIPFHHPFGMLLTQLEDHIGRQWCSRKDWEMHLREIGLDVLQNFRIGILLLIEIIGWKCQNIESPR